MNDTDLLAGFTRRERTRLIALRVQHHRQQAGDEDAANAVYCAHLAPTSAMVPRLRSLSQAARVLFRRLVWVLALVAAYHAMHSAVWAMVARIAGGV